MRKVKDLTPMCASTCGKKFRDIIVGACLAVGQALPMVIKEFIDQKVETDNAYPAKAKKTYYQFCRGRLKFPSEQVEVLAEFGLLCSPLSIDTARVSPQLEKQCHSEAFLGGQLFFYGLVLIFFIIFLYLFIFPLILDFIIYH